jgi:hypothetical protein
MEGRSQESLTRALLLVAFSSALAILGCGGRRGGDVIGHPDGGADADSDSDSDGDVDSDSDSGACSAPAEGSWTTDVVDAAGDVGRGVSIGVDAVGQPHASYYDATNDALKHATRSDSWAASVIDPSARAMPDEASPFESSTSLAIDPADGTVHVFYGDALTSTVRHARMQDGAWSIEDISAPGETATAPSMAIDSAGTIHLAYRRCAEASCAGWYANDRTGEWSGEAVGAGLGERWLSVDAFGVAHVVWNVTPIGVEDLPSVQYGTRTDEGWVNETVATDPLGLSVLGVGLALDAAADPHILYLVAQGEISDLHLASRVGGDWTREGVDPSGGASSLAIDAAGFSHVAYRDVTTGALRYATNSGGAWSRQTIDDSTTVGNWVSLAISGCTLHVAYYDATDGELRHAEAVGE